jgi:hypothetical protein
MKLYCSMCGLSSKDVRYLMAGVAGGHICDRCTIAAMKILASTRAREAMGTLRRR